MSGVFGGGGIRWSSREIDFSTQPTQTLASDGAYTIGGLEFTKINTANEASAMVVTNGVGLEIRPAAASAFGGASRTLPALTIALGTAIPNFTYETRFRFWMYIAAQNITTSTDQVVMGVERLPPTLTSFRQAIEAIPAAIVGGGMTWNSVDAFDTEDTTPLPNTLMFDVTYGLGALQFHGYYGNVGTAFTLAEMTNAGYAYKRDLGDNAIANVDTNGFGSLAGDCQLILGAGRGGSGTSLHVVIGAIKLEYTTDA